MDTSTDPDGLEPLLTEAELASRLNVTPRLLKRGRLSGTGPPFLKLGPRTVRYQLRPVTAWLATKMASRVETSGVAARSAGRSPTAYMAAHSRAKLITPKLRSVDATDAPAPTLESP